MTTRTRSFNLADIFEAVAEAVPERIAFVCGTQRLSYRELDRRATQLASALREQGVQRGDNVGIELYNSAEYLEAFFACCKIGAAPANINYRYVADELEQLFGSLQLRALVYGAAFAAEIAQVAPRLPRLRTLLQVGTGGAVPGALDYEALRAAGSATLSDPQRSGDDLSLLCTGGTTGLPKGVMWPHKNLFMGALGGGGMYLRCPPFDSVEALAAAVPQAPPMTFFALAPLMHAAALWATLISLYTGHTVLVNDQHHFDPEHIWDLAQREGANIVSGVGDAMALPLVKALEAHRGRWPLQHLMIYGNGGALLSASLAERIKAALPHITVTNGMGSSETGVTGGGDKPGQGEGFMVLQPRPELAVIDAELRIVSAPGARGILARSGYTPVGYYGDAKKTAQTFVPIDGRIWVLSGDEARLDEQGRIVVLGRGSQCIVSGGEKIFPEEVEEALRRYDAVHDVLVVGLSDERWGERVAAVIELAPGAQFSPAALDQVCRQHLAGYKAPRAVFIADKVQRSPAGKADYRWAKAFAAAQRSVI